MIDNKPYIEISLKKLVLITFFFSLISPLLAQDILQGQINRYLPVGSFSGSDAVIISDTTGIYQFRAGDKVLLIQMTGVTLQMPSGWEKSSGLRSSWQSTGKYEFVSVSSVDKVNGKITFTSNLVNAYNINEKIQLVKVVESENAVVTNPLVAKKWDGSTGGIVALVVYRKLVLNNGINVTGLGFRGAVPETNYTGGCRTLVAGTDTFYFQTTQLNRAGNKGEGVISAVFPYTKGAGHSMTGGGGGNGLYSGGGGGSNYGAGGKGGLQSDICSPGNNLIAADGGKSLDSATFYFLDKINQKCVIMGGGGGSTTTDGSSALFKGGDGGGIVFIITDTLESNNATITADGLNGAAGAANAGGSGGGSGGTVVLDINTYIGTLNISAKGGNGGSTNDNCTGAGGGGGGGVVLYSKWSFGINVDLSNGTPGAVGGSCLTHQATSGLSGKAVSKLQIVLNGFFFNTVNSISGTDTVCEGQIPNTLMGSIPKGGSGDFDYQWQKRGISESSWSNVGAFADSIFYTPGPLSETSYFRRYISTTISTFHGDTVQTDTSQSVEIYVFPKIENNVLNIKDTLCQSESPGTLTGGQISGGNGSYNYMWQKSIDQQSWDTVSYNPGYAEGQLQLTTYYRRIVTSAGVCADTSNKGVVIVYEVPQANAGADDSICGLNYTLHAIPSVGNGMWQADNSVFVDPTLPAAPVTVSGYGSTIFTWTETNWKCTDQNQVKVTFFQQPGPTDAGTDQTLDYTFTTELNALAADVGSGSWSFIQGSGDFVDVASAKTTVHLNNVGDNILKWTVKNGVCETASDSVIVTIKDLHIEKGFSPNGDGANDRFVIDLKGVWKAEMIIFNRWGNVIFQTDDYTSENYWDGKDKNGRDVPEDTYFYIFKEEGRPVRKGFVELRR